MEAGVDEAFRDICAGSGLDWNTLQEDLLRQGRYHVETY
jgi:benzoyl-CoA 2,3-dioxygenase component A